MKLLQNKPNVDAPGGDYPFGNMRDDAPPIVGTDADTEFMTDYVQFFEKMFNESGLVANGLPDNDNDGFQLFEAFQALTRDYKVYNVNLTQTGTNDPVPTVLGSNQIGNIVWTRTGVGTYQGLLNGAFPDATKLQMFVNHFPTFVRRVNITRVSANVITLFTADLAGAAQDGALNNTSIELRVFP